METTSLPEAPDLYIRAFSTPDYEPFNTIFDVSLAETIKAYSGKYDIKHVIHKVENVETNENTEFRSAAWQGIVHYKIQFVIKMLYEFLESLKQNSIFIFSDCDIQFFKKNAEQWNNLITWFTNQSKCVAFMREGDYDKLNSGFYILKGEYALTFIKILEQVDAELHIHKDLEFVDQTVLQILQPYMDMVFIPDEFIIFGPETRSIKALFHHAVGFPTRSDKVKIMDMVKKFIELEGTVIVRRL
jgi:hypothetical protein